MNRQPGTRYRPFVLAFLLLGAFVVGAVVDRMDWLPGTEDRPPPGLGRTFAPFWEAWHLVQDYYVDRDAIQPERMTRGAIEGMLASLGDVGHTGYATPEEYQQLESGLAGHLEGIGASLTIRKR